MKKQQSRVLFENRVYVVCITSAGLTVQDKTKGSGKRLAPGDQCDEWVSALDDPSGDAVEKVSLCQGLLQA